jgi:hypothetical protein
MVHPMYGDVQPDVQTWEAHEICEALNGNCYDIRRKIVGFGAFMTLHSTEKNIEKHPLAISSRNPRVATAAEGAQQGHPMIPSSHTGDGENFYFNDSMIMLYDSSINKQINE